MKRVAAAVLAIALALSGCLAGIGAQSPGGSETTPGTEQLPSPPGQLNASSAESFALEYERMRLTNWLSESYATDSFGVGCCTAPKSASVVTQRSNVYYVYVQYPYYYDTADAETDAATQAMYVVSSDDVTRIGLRGRVLTVDDPYSAANDTANAAPPRLYVVNAASGDREVSLTLTHLGAGETAFDRNVTLRANASVEVSQVALRKGEYQLTVSADGRTRNGRFIIDDSGSTPTFVLLTGDGILIARNSASANRSTAT